ncbi:MAG: TonB-dependent receptor [Salibacteraceae bacterium]
MKTAILSIIILFSTLAHAQTISGTVKDKEGNPLPGANVYIENTFSGTSTDLNGKFSFPFSDTGSFHIVTEFVGFEDFKQPLLLSGMNLQVQISLKEKFNQLKAVTITAGNYGTGKSETAVVMSSLEMVTTAGSLGDINAAMRSLPGTSNNGESGKLFVHGGDGNETGTYIDGIYVHQPYTSSAPNMAVRGRFNPFMFKGTSFSTGGYSAEYGQALSSVLTLNTNDMPLEDELNISLMTVGADLAGTKKWKNGAITASANYINLKPYMTLTPQNYDWNQEPTAFGGSMNFRQKTKGSGMLKLYASVDQSNLSQLQPMRDGTNQNTATDVQNNNQFVNLNWHGSPSKKWFLTLGGSFTHNKDEFTRQTNILTQKLIGNHLKSTAKYEFNEKTRLRFGIENTFSDVSYKYQISNLEVDSTVGFKENVTAGFVEGQIYASTKLLFNIGLRGERSEYLNGSTLSPRFSMAFKTNEKSSLSLAYGWFYQNPLNEQLINRDYLQNEMAEHFIISFTKTVNKRTLRSEIYYKNYSNLVKYGVQHTTPYTNEGTGYAYGLDVYFKDAKTIKNGSFWISYSYLKAERNYRYYPEKAIPTFVVPHSLTFVYKHWIGDWRSYVGGSFRYGSSRVYNDKNSTEFNTGKLPTNMSLDLNWSFLYRENIILYASATNVLGFEQVYGYQYDAVPNAQGVFNRTPILPAANSFFFVGCFITLSKKGEANQLDKINF